METEFRRAQKCLISTYGSPHPGCTATKLRPRYLDGPPSFKQFYKWEVSNGISGGIPFLLKGREDRR